jgi:hypothetical protein
MRGKLTRKPKPKRPAFAMQNIDPGIWSPFTARCQSEMRPYRRVVLELVKRYGSGELTL